MEKGPLAMRQWFKRRFDQFKSPILDWIQVEVTTHCTSACIYCPHTILNTHWENRHMSLELFSKLVPFIRNTKLIYLQGWGEPLLNENIFEMIRICKDNGRRVGFTTNGMLLNEKTIRKLIGLKTDILGVSLAGTTPKTHNNLRKGNDFKVVISHLERLSEIKRETRSPVPALHFAYIMLTSNFNELKGIVQLAKRVSAQQIVSSHLSLILDSELFTEAVFNDLGRTGDYYMELETISALAKQQGIIFEYNGLNLNDHSQHCSENVCHSCVINVDGEVLPCVFANPVICVQRDSADKKPATYIFKKESYPLEGFSFGNIRHDSFSRIWKGSRYARFRDLFRYGNLIAYKHFISHLPYRCSNCYKRLLS